MCGRFSITGDLDFYAEYFGVDDIDTDLLADLIKRSYEAAG